MKKYFILTLLAFSFAAQAQVTANRFFYELTYKPKKGSETTEKVMSVLDITPEKSYFQDYTFIAQDSIVKVKMEEMQKTQAYKDIRNDIKMPKFSYKITKSYPSMELQYKEGILNGMSIVYIAYNETPKFEWKIESETKKIGEYSTQKATTNYGGRSWIAWFSKDLPMQDGPYKFSGLPGLIVKVEDTEQNYSWELKGNKPVPDFMEYSTMEKAMAGATPKIMELDRAKFETKFNEFKENPFGSIKSQIPMEMMNKVMPGGTKTMAEILRDEEKKQNEIFSANNNPIEISKVEVKKKK